MAPVLPLVLSLLPRIHLAQGLWLFSWLLVVAGGLTLLCSGHLLVQLCHLDTFLAPSCALNTLPRLPWQLVSGSGHGAVGCGSQQDQSGCSAVPSLARRLGPSLVAGAAGGGQLLVLTLGLTCCCLEAGRWPKEGLGTALLTTRTQKGLDTHAKWLLDELQLWHHCCGHHGDKDWFEAQ